MSFYTETAAEAKALLKEFGQVVTLRTKTAGAYDPATGTAPETTTEQTGLYAALFKYQTKDIDGTKIKQGDSRVIIEAAATPSVDSLLVTATDTYTVITSEAVAPAGTAVISKLQVRKA